MDIFAKKIAEWRAVTDPVQYIIDKYGGLKEDEYIKDGLILCKECNTPRMFVSDDPAFPSISRIICKCQTDEINRQKKEREMLDNYNRYKNLQAASLIEERYYNVSFDNTDLNRHETFINAFNRCKKYCENYEIVAEKGYGIYLWGASGTGKTHLMACMVNELTKKYVPCLFTNFLEISKEIKKTYGKSNVTESELIDKLATIPFLFIDDFGTEKVQTRKEDNWLQDKIYDIINKRYNAQKPTVFSSNLKINELTEINGLMSKTTDRVIEMSNAIIEVKGSSYRLIKRDTNIPF